MNPHEKSEASINTQLHHSTTTQITSESNLKMIRALSMLTWALTFLYVCRILPYTFLIPFGIFMIAGAVAYFRAKSLKSK